MKWKVTGRYILSMILVVLIIIFINILILIGLFVSRISSKGPDVLNAESSPEKFTREFQSEVIVEDEGIELTDFGVSQLAERDAWIQVLDEDGAEVFAYGTPRDLQRKYSPVDVVQMYKYKEIEDTTVFVGEKKTADALYSYLVGIEDYGLNRYFIYFFSYNDEVLRVFRQVGLWILFVDMLVALLVAYIFSKYLTQPLHGLIGGIQQLAHKDYDVSFPTDGVYGDVFYNVNELSEELKLSEREREKLETLRKEWIGNVSHDVKTPLASIQGYAELIKEPAYDFSAEEMREYAEIIEQKSLYIEDLLNDLNITTRLGDKTMTLNTTSENVVSLVRAIIIDILNDAKYADRKINFHTDTEEIMLPVDAFLFKRALNNLIYNAIVHNDADVEIDIYLEEQPNGVGLQIKDNGRGIKPEDLDKIFDRYYRGTNTGDSHKGSGLGMVISRDIIEAHGGQIKISSQVEQGTTAKIFFPK